MQIIYRRFSASTIRRVILLIVLYSLMPTLNKSLLAQVQLIQTKDPILNLVDLEVDWDRSEVWYCYTAHYQLDSFGYRPIGPGRRVLLGKLDSVLYGNAHEPSPKYVIDNLSYSQMMPFDSTSHLVTGIKENRDNIVYRYDLESHSIIDSIRLSVPDSNFYIQDFIFNDSLFIAIGVALHDSSYSNDMLFLWRVDTKNGFQEDTLISFVFPDTSGYSACRGFEIAWAPNGKNFWITAGCTMGHFIAKFDLDMEMQLHSLPLEPHWYHNPSLSVLNTGELLDLNYQSYYYTPSGLPVYDPFVSLTKLDSTAQVVDSIVFNTPDTIDAVSWWGIAQVSPDEFYITYHIDPCFNCNNGPYYGLWPNRVAIARLNNNLEVQWYQEFGDDTYYHVSDIEFLPDSTLLVAGTVYNYDTATTYNLDLFLIHLNRDGTPVDSTSVGIEELHVPTATEAPVQAVPNPGSKGFWVESLQPGPFRLEVFSAAGRHLATRPAVRPGDFVSAAGWPQGVLLLRWQLPGGTWHTQRWLRQ